MPTHLLAALVSIVASVIAGYLEVGHHAYWRRWAGGRYLRSILALVAVYAIAGYGGWYLAESYVRLEESQWLLDGLIGFAITQAVFRFDATVFEHEGRGSARSLLLGVENHLVGRLDGTARDAVLENVRALDHEALEQLAFDIFQVSIVESKNVPETTKVELGNTLDQCAAAMPSVQARSRLIAFCAKAIKDDRLTFRFTR